MIICNNSGGSVINERVILVEQCCPLANVLIWRQTGSVHDAASVRYGVSRSQPIVLTSTFAKQFHALRSTADQVTKLVRDGTACHDTTYT